MTSQTASSMAKEVARKFRVIGDERYEKAFEEEVFQALLSERKAVIEECIKAVKSDAQPWAEGALRKLLEER